MSDCDHINMNRAPAKAALAAATIMISAAMNPLVAMRLQPRRKMVFISFSLKRIDKRNTRPIVIIVEALTVAIIASRVRLMRRIDSISS